MNKASSMETVKKKKKKKAGYTISMASSILSWTTIAYVALSRHPTPSVQAVTSLRHNFFTIAQALAFPVPVLVSVFLELLDLLPENDEDHHDDDDDSDDYVKSCYYRRLNLGVAVASLWSASAFIWCPTFSVGYDLFSSLPPLLSKGLPLSQILVAVFVLWNWRESVEQQQQQQQQQLTEQQEGYSSQDTRNKKGKTYSFDLLTRIINGCIDSFYQLLSPSRRINSQCYALATKGLFLLSILPQLVSFPHATIPTLLGKRLSRAASGFTFLGAVAALCLFGKEEEKDDDAMYQTIDNRRLQLQRIRRGLGLGSFLHITLVWAKIIGLDGGGLLFPGRGLWKDYPSLVNASGAVTSLMMVTYTLMIYATTIA